MHLLYIIIQKVSLSLSLPPSLPPSSQSCDMQSTDRASVWYPLTVATETDLQTQGCQNVSPMVIIIDVLTT